MSSAPATQLQVMGYMALNFATSVGIIWVNKVAMNMGFKWTISLTILHFAYTFVGLELCARYGMFQKRPLSVMSVVPISLAFCGFVVFNNLSLQYNAVGMYQLMKVMTTPVIVMIQYSLYNTKLPTMQIISLVPVCIGVLLATVTHLEANFYGTLWGCMGIISTSMYQIWVKTQQEALGCNPQQLLYYQAPVSCLMLCVLAPFCEQWTGPDGLLNFEWTGQTSVWVNFSALLAFLVNLSIFLVIGKTSPVSYNVLGHGKLCVILLSGYVLFGEPMNMKCFCGILFAVSGIFWYTHLKLQPAAPKHVPLPQEEDDAEMVESGGAKE